MRISPLERLKAQRDLFDTREGSKFLYICIPLLVDQNFDGDTLSADNITSGNGLGQIAGEWRIYTLRAHFRNVDSNLIAYGHIPPGVEIGDSLVNFSPRDLPAINQSMQIEDSYILIEDDTYHSVSIVPTGLGKNEEWCLDARRFSPRFRAPGY